MRGKIVNLCMALLNFLLGAVIIVFTFKIPTEITELTVQEYKIIHIIKILIYITLGITNLFNLIQFFFNIRDEIRKTGYLIAIFSISFIFIKEWPIAIFSILSACIIAVSTLRERWVETNSITFISLLGIVIVLAGFVIGSCFIYKSLGVYMLNKENANELSYKNDYFKYITELEINEPYINIKKNGLYGYINLKGETVIDYQFDYASPFVPITMYNKNFEIALVCKDGSTWIILKNLRKVLTYRSESMDEDFALKEQELKDVYYNILKQTEKMHYEIDITTINNRNKVPAYSIVSDSYTYRYDYNDDYDVIVTQSNLGFGDTYELAKKDDLNFRIELDCEKLCYDENYLYILSNGTIPFYDISKNRQGWFTQYGKKEILRGKAQILEIVNDTILIKNHQNNTIYFIDNDGNIVSDIYKEVFVCDNNRFIVKNDKNKYMVIDSNFKKVFDSEWDFVDTSLISAGLYIFGITSGVIEFSEYNYAENMNLNILDYNGNVIIENVQQIYNKTYSILGEKEEAYSKRYSDFLNDLKVLNYTFVGDEFYKN